jgi:hypothetical protein
MLNLMWKALIKKELIIWSRISRDVLKDWIHLILFNGHISHVGPTAPLPDLGARICSNPSWILGSTKIILFSHSC